MKDETTKTAQDTSPEKETPSGGKPGTTPETEPQTYTQDQAQKMVSDALSKAGRDAKSFEERETAIKTREDAVKAAQEERDAADLAEAQKDPDNLAVYQSKKAERERVKTLDEREANLTRDKAEHEAEVKAAQETQLEIKIWEIAQEHGVDPVVIKDTMAELNLTTVEQAKAVAKRLSETKPSETVTVDSGMTTGALKDLSGKSPIELAREGYSKSK